MAAVPSWGDAYRENAFSERTTGWGEAVEEDAGGALARSDRDMAASYREEGGPGRACGPCWRALRLAM